MAESGLRDKIPPNNLEAEKATLGAILMNSDSLLTVSRILRPDDFYKNANKKIYQAMLNLDQQNSSNVDILTVIQELKRIGELEAAGGAAYVSSLTSEVPTTANVEYYAQIVQDNSVRRSLIQTSNEIIAGAFDDTVATGTMLENAERKIFDITEKHHSTDYKSVSSLVSPAFDIIQNRMGTKAECTGIPSGYSALDYYTNGFQNSELIVIGARPSKGKTALALSMAANMAGKSVLLKTLALTQYLFQFGFYVPAQRASLCVVEEIISSIGDRQSELSGLSSFAVEILTIDKIIQEGRAGKRVLALVDELARTTNPEEGKVLVGNFIRLTTQLGITALVTTHYGGIEASCRRLRVKGLQLKEGQVITAGNISDFMDYALVETDADEVPMEAFTIARLFGVDDELLAKPR